MLIISNGADVNAKADDGMTPYHIAAVKGHKEIAELLFAKGSDVNAMDEGGKTPLDWAVKENRTESLYFLRRHGAKSAEELKAEGK